MRNNADGSGSEGAHAELVPAEPGSANYVSALESHYACSRFVDSATLRHARPLRCGRTQRVAHRVSLPTVARFFDIEVARETGGQLIRIPEIG
jgi:hypothetical protein